MATKDAQEVTTVRLIIRVAIPQADLNDVPDLQRQIQNVVKGQTGAEVEVSILPTLPAR